MRRIRIMHVGKLIILCSLTTLSCKESGTESKDDNRDDMKIVSQVNKKDKYYSLRIFLSLAANQSLKEVRYLCKDMKWGEPKYIENSVIVYNLTSPFDVVPSSPAEFCDITLSFKDGLLTDARYNLTLQYPLSLRMGTGITE